MAQEKAVKKKLGKDDRWLYGELLQKKWGISRHLLTTFVRDGLPIYDADGAPFCYEDGVDDIDTMKFKIEDVERFERDNRHLFEIAPTPMILNRSDDAGEEGELGKRMTAEQVAALMKVNVKKVRSMYKELGGMRLGRNYLFFERSVKDAIQKRTEVDSPSAEGREATGEGVPHQEAGIGLGGQDAAKTRKRLEREDRHGLFK
jgi:hypothetical protein